MTSIDTANPDQFVTPSWATERRTPAYPPGVVEWSAKVALLPGAALVTDNDVTVSIYQSSPNDKDAATTGPTVLITAGLDTTEIMPADARVLAAALIAAADVADGIA